MRRQAILVSFLMLFAAPTWALNVVTTTGDLASLVQTLGGNAVTVQSIAKPAQNPHYLAAKPGFMRMVHDADWVVAVGLDLEGAWLPALLQGARNPDVMPGTPGFTDASVFVRVLGKPSGPVDRSMGDVHPLGNPHYWLDPANLKALAEGLAGELKRRQPDKAADIDARLIQWRQRFDAKSAEWSERMAPFKGSAVVTYHPSYSYLLDAFGLTLLGTVEPKPGIPPSLPHLNELAQRMKAANAKVILMEPWHDRDGPDWLAGHGGAQVLEAPSLCGDEAAPDGIALIDLLVSRLAEGLQ